jgi:hypothetical protein
MLNRVIRKRFTEKVKFEQRSKLSKRMSYALRKIHCHTGNSK